MRRWRYVVPRERSAVGTFADAMEKDLSEAGVAESVRQSLATVLDELLANVIMHAQGANGPIHVRMRVTHEELVARLRYCAHAFDPTSTGAAKTTCACAWRFRDGLINQRICMKRLRSRIALRTLAN